jgi:hypothetical protein
LEGEVSVAGHGPRRGGPDDFYETPAWCVARLLEAWRPRAGAILEPAAGDGAIIRAASGLEREWTAVECRATAAPALGATGAGIVIADFLSWEPPSMRLLETVTTVWTNPPFKDAEAFIRRSALIFPDADLVFLVRLGFLASEGRLALWRDLGAPDVYVLPNRPSFTPDGGTDSADYAWIVLPGEERRKEGTFKVLASTPVSVRRGVRT